MDHTHSITQMQTLGQLRQNEIYYFNLSAADHRVLSADVEVLGFLSNDLFSSFEDLLAPADREHFLQVLESRDPSWFRVHVGTSTEKHSFFLHLEAQEAESYYRFAIAKPLEIVEHYKARSEMIEALFGVLALQDAVCFMAKPVDSTIYVLQSGVLFFREQPYTIEEFGRILTSCCADEEQRMEVQKFLSSIEHGAAAFNNRVTGDLLGIGNGIRYTLLKGMTNLMPDGSISVYCTIQAETGRAARQSAIGLDYLTGILGKEDITKVAISQIDEQHAPDTNLAIIDIDYFKSINDTYGHKKGDEVLQKVASALKNEIGSDGILGRFGGDEFMILFRPGITKEQLREHFSSIKNTIRSLFPLLSPKGDTPMTVSIGSALYPTDADNFDDLFMIADYCLYLAKNKGRNRYIIYTPEKHLPLEEIRLHKMNEPSLPARDNTTISDTLINLLYDAEYGDKPSAEYMLSKFWPHVDVSAMAIFAGAPYKLVYSRFAEGAETSVDIDTAVQLLSAAQLAGSRDIVCVNQLSSLPASAAPVRAFLEAADVQSFVLIHFTDAAGAPAVLFLASIHAKRQWNQLHFRYYRLFTDVLHKCVLSDPV